MATASNFSNIVSATTVGTRTIGITGSAMDGASAAGYSAFISSITGKAPTVIQQGKNAVIVLSPDQIKAVQKWIETQILKSVIPSKAPGAKPPVTSTGKGSLQLNTGPVVGPMVLKYGLIFGGIFFTAGYLTRGMIK